MLTESYASITTFNLFLLPDCSRVIVVDDVTAVMRVVVHGSVGAVLLTHGVLVNRSIRLGGGVVLWRDAVTRLAAIIAVPVVHRAVWVFICSKN